MDVVPVTEEKEEKEPFSQELDEEAPTLGFQSSATKPKVMAQVSPYAQEIIDTLQEALENKNGEELSNLVFDAECEGLENQIDLTWYE